MTTPSIFESAAIRATIAQIAAAAATRDSMIVCGESGTGREQIARAIADGACLHAAAREEQEAGVGPGSPNPAHRDGTIATEAAAPVALASSRDERALATPPDAPFFIVDCGTPDVRALEAYLFGTISRLNADSDDALDVLGGSSRLVLACGGTITLRNVSELPWRLQVRLARLLREREALLADTARSRIDLDIRIIVLLEPGFEGLVTEGRLAPELLKRMSGMRVDAPPLRSRREDVPGLVARMIEALAMAMHMTPKRVSVAAVQLLAALPWRGNLPELRGLLQLLMVKVPGPVIRLADVLGHVRLDGAATPQVRSGTLKEARERFEREYVALVLEQHKGRMAEAAKALGIQRTNLYRKVRQLSVGRPNGRRP